MIKRRFFYIIVIVAVTASACGTGTGGTTTVPATTAPTTTAAAPPTTVETENDHELGSAEPSLTPGLIDDLAAIRVGSASYANSLEAAMDDGFFMITQMIPDMGYHFLNPNVEGFETGHPPILVYSREGDDWQLAAVEWVFPEEPAEPPLEGAVYGAFPAACHFEDGLFVPETDEGACAGTHFDTSADITFWHPDLVTFHVWAWMHNPDGLYHGTNPHEPFQQRMIW